MAQFILRRLFYGFLVLYGVVTIVFLIFNLLPGDPARMMLGQRADQEAIEEINAELGFNESIFKQYVLYLNDLSPLSFHNKINLSNEELELKYGSSFSFETKNFFVLLKKPFLRLSYQKRKKVSSILLESLPETAILAVSSILIAIIIGVFFGLLSALYSDSWFDKLLLLVSTSGMALPSFFVGIIFAWLFGFVLSNYTGLNMTGSLYEVDDLGKGEFLQLKNLILPAITLGIRPLSVIIQLSRNSFLEVMQMDFTRTARAKGILFLPLILRHILRNALNPVVTAVSGMFASLMAGAVFVEIIFSWKGIGWEIVDALEKYDLPVIMGAVLIIAAIFVMINIVVDIIYGLLDPRVRYS